MRDPDTSGLDSHSSDSEEESFEPHDSLDDQLEDFLGNQTSLDGSSLPENKPIPTDLADLGRALFLEDKEKRFKRLYGARLVQGNQVENTTTSHGNGILAGASLPCISNFQPHLGDAEHSRVSVLSNSDHTVETCNNSLDRSVSENCAIDECVLWEREEHAQFGREEEREVQLIREQSARERHERGERGSCEAENLLQQQEAITGQTHWLCEHYQQQCRVRFTCCTQFYPCHWCHNISKACYNEEAKACHATHLKCSHCQHEQEIGEDSAKCRKCGGKMSAYFCAICKHFASVDKNPYHCEKCGVCRIHQDKSFHCEVCNVCLDKRLEGNHRCWPDSGYDQFCSEDAFSGCQILPGSWEFHRECAKVAGTESGIGDRNHGVCLCKSCLSSREGVDREVSSVLPLSAESSNSCTDCSANFQVAPEGDDSNYDNIFYEAPHSLPEGIAPNLLARHTQDKALKEIALTEMSHVSDIPSQHTSSSYLDPVLDVVFGWQRANSYFGDDWQNASDTVLDGSLESILSTWSSEQCEGQRMDDGSWAGAVRSHLGFALHGAVGGAFYTSLHDSLAHGNPAINENCSTAVLERGAGFGDDMFAWSSAEVLAGELPSCQSSSVSDLNSSLQASSDDWPTFTSLHSQSQQDWNCTGARPQREVQNSILESLPSQPHQDDAVPVLTPDRPLSATTDWVSPVAGPQEVQYSLFAEVIRERSSDESVEDESLQFDGGREETEDLEGGIDSAFLLKYSQDDSLRTWARQEHLLMEEGLEQLETRMKSEEKLIREKRARQESQGINSCNVQVHTAHKVPVENCVNCNQIIDAQQQESHPCHPDKCCICQEYVDAFIGCYELPCGHKFHMECYLNMLLNNTETCPLCRRPF